jgi:hypothetical protein
MALGNTKVCTGIEIPVKYILSGLQLWNMEQQEP